MGWYRLKYRICFFLSLIFLVIFTSCGDVFLSTPEEASLEVSTQENGVILTPRGRIPVEVTLLSGDYQEKALTIELFDEEGQLLGENRVSGADLAEIPPLALPEDIEPGSYRLALKVFNGANLNSERILSFFIVKERPRLNGIASFPVVLQPKAQALLSLDMPPTKGDPWIRWSLEGEIIRRGLLSELSRRITMRTPKTAGIYTVKAELFPFPPPQGEEWSFSSAVFEESPIYVSQEIHPGNYDLDPPESFCLLYHFRGEYSDWGSQETPMDLLPREEPVLDEHLGIFGYRLDQFDGFKADRFPFPVSPEGRLEPFSLVIVMASVELPREGELFLGENEAGDFRLTLAINEEGLPLVSMRDGETIYGLEFSEPWDLDTYSLLTLSVIPDYENRELQLLFYRGGELLAQSSGNWERTDFDQQGRFFIGGSKGAPVVLDELGIFYRDVEGRPSSSSDMFLKDRQGVYGARLIYADGFDGPHLQKGGIAEWLVEQGFRENKPYRLKFGSLGIAPEARYLFPPLPLDNKEVSGILTFKEEIEEGAVIQFMGTFDEEKNLLGEFSLEGRSDLAFTLSLAEERLVFSEKKAVPLMRRLSGIDTIRMGLANRGEAYLFIEDLIFLKEGLRLSAEKKAKNPRNQRASTESITNLGKSGKKEISNDHPSSEAYP